MIITTTHSVPNREVEQVLGLVAGEAVFGANVFRDIFASVRDIVGGRSGGYQKVFAAGREAATHDMVEEAMEMGADAIIGVDLDYETVGKSMLMVSANGTAVKLR
ncbi:MAG: YbjQ family protein [Rhizobiaceae bacterium]